MAKRHQPALQDLERLLRAFLSQHESLALDDERDRAVLAAELAAYVVWLWHSCVPAPPI